MSEVERPAPGYDELTPEARKFHDEKTQSLAEPQPVQSEIGQNKLGLSPGEIRLSTEAKDDLAEKRMWPDDIKASEDRKRILDIQNMRELATGMRMHNVLNMPEEQANRLADILEEQADKLEQESK
ncbi:MAG: hypothetical protein NTY30_03615 [Candidatus Berkelbacteria bacterium]|nr:hypothetical protein [Candidatus Berkelbacteria bacterium]